MKFNLKLLLSILLLSLALLLALKNPYDTQSLVPNLEPYPDTLFYAYPALNFLKTGNFSMATTMANPRIVTPPGFSLYMLPFFAVRQNVLDFFWAQILLLIGTVWLLIKTLHKLFPEHWLLWTTPVFFFVTNFYVFTMPSLLMAELLAMFLFTVMLYLFVSEPTQKNIMLAGVVGVALLFIKFSNAPIVVIWYGAYFLKAQQKQRLFFIKATACAGILFAVYLFGSNLLDGHKNLQEGASFHLSYMKSNIPFYIQTLLGRGTHYLWYQEKLLSPLVSIVGLFGLLYGLFEKRFRFLSLSIVAYMAGLIIFMSTFITPDARYLSILLPALAVGFGISLHTIHARFGKPLLYSACFGVVLLYLMVPLFSQSSEPYVITLKKQVGLNYLHPEQPWNYMAVQEMNSFVATLPSSNKKIHVGTFLPPHYVNFFASGFTPIPLSDNQEFFTAETNIEKLYDRLLTTGDVYVTNAYQNNNRPAWPDALQVILKKYDAKMVHTGCFESCNIYKLNIRYEKKNQESKNTTIKR